VLLPHGAVQQDPQARADEMLVTAGRVAVKYHAASPSLLRLADVYYPGWEASVEGKPLQILRVNHALMGAVVPAGSHEVVFEFKPTRFRLGAAISAIALLLLLLGASLRRR